MTKQEFVRGYNGGEKSREKEEKEKATNRAKSVQLRRTSLYSLNKMIQSLPQQQNSL